MFLLIKVSFPLLSILNYRKNKVISKIIKDCREKTLRKHHELYKPRREKCTKESR